MLRSPKFRPIRNGILFLCLGLGAVFLFHAGQDLLSKDPLQNLRKGPSKEDEDASLEMHDVVLRHYDRGSLVHEALVGKFTVSRDRRVTRATTIQDGKLFRDGKLELTYDATRAEWDDYAKQLRADGKIHAKNKELDLRTTELYLDTPSGKMEMNKPLEGKFYGGELKAVKLLGQLKQNKFTAYSVEWQGTAKPDVIDRPPRKWNVKAKSISTLNDDLVEYVQPDATDGEVAVRAASGTWNRKEDIFVATGGVRYFSKEVNVVCEKVTLYRKTRRAVLEGRVTMLIKPEDQRKLEITELAPMRPIVPEEILKNRPAAPSDADKQLDKEVHKSDSKRKYPVTVTASAIEYFYGQGSRRATITGSPQARQDLPGGRWRHIWASAASWNGETDTLTLNSSGNTKSVRFMTSLGDDLRARSASISTKEDENRYTIVEPEGVVYNEDDDEIPRSKSDSKSPPPDSGGTLSGPIG